MQRKVSTCLVLLLLLSIAGPLSQGKEFGKFGIHKSQPLVLVNYGGAKGGDIYKLSLSIKEIIKKIFKIELETEVNII